MPLTEKGEKIENALKKEYGAKKGEEVLYAGKNAGTFTGIDNPESSWSEKMKEAGKSADISTPPAPTQGTMDRKSRTDAIMDSRRKRLGQKDAEPGPVNT